MYVSLIFRCNLTKDRQTVASRSDAILQNSHKIALPLYHVYSIWRAINREFLRKSELLSYFCPEKNVHDPKTWIISTLTLNLLEVLLDVKPLTLKWLSQKDQISKAIGIVYISAVSSCKHNARYPVYDTAIERFEGRLYILEGLHQYQMSLGRFPLVARSLLYSEHFTASSKGLLRDGLQRLCQIWYLAKS